MSQLTRRAALQLAAAFAAANAAPAAAVSPEEAAALLDGPAEFDPGLGRLGPSRGTDFDDPLTRLDEAALSLWCVSWMAGDRAGAAYEGLRRALVVPRRSCSACHGNGRLWGGSPFRGHDDGTNGETCARCGGRGTLPTPAPALGFAADRP